MTTREPKSCWQNCSGTDDEEVRLIDAMEDSLGVLDEETIQIRRLITLFEACYHEADKEAEFIAAAIGPGHCPPRSNQRPPQRQRELENARQILSTWCRNSTFQGIDGVVGGLRPEEVSGFLGEPNRLKVWQVTRIVDRINHALDPGHPYHNLILSVGDYGEPSTGDAREHHEDDAVFLQQTRETIIHDTAGGGGSKISLAYAIDLLMPCGWDFVGSLVTSLKAIGGELHAQRPLACCARNIQLSPLCGRLRTISGTLNVFWKGPMRENVDRQILTSLGAPTPVKSWLAASLDKTIRLHLEQPFDMDLF